MSNEYAIFVSPTGKDGAGGSKAGPVKTIAKAVELAGTTKIVIACSGTFDEQVKLTTGAKLYGGFSCPGAATPWVYEQRKKSKVAPSTRGIALSVAVGAAAVVVQDFEFDALDGTDPGESSVAAFVNTSGNVALSRVKLIAGKGVNGANGTMTPVPPPTQSLKGNNASGDTGGAFNLITCPAGGTTKGGPGGNGGTGLNGGGPGAPDLGAGKGGTVGASCSGVTPSGGGSDGADAMPQPPAAGATKLGSITPSGWIGAAGADGAPGAPGQGGGGGTGAATGGGGGGGAGGCGGAAGTGGKSGGSSIALLVLNSTISLSASELVAGDAGKGGDGVAGQDGQALGGSAGLQVPDGCSGGKGGKGGKGGAGGGAAGGVSLGLAYQGMVPSTDAEMTFTTGALGAKGLGGVPGTNDGIDGVKQDVLLVP